MRDTRLDQPTGRVRGKEKAWQGDVLRDRVCAVGLMVVVGGGKGREGKGRVWCGVAWGKVREGDGVNVDGRVC